jgi:hypothetical protein
MRRIALFSLLALTAPALAPAAQSATSRRRASPKCPPAHSTEVVADKQAEVYLAPRNREYPEDLSVYGCSFRYRRSYVLGPLPQLPGSPGGSGGGVELETLAGPAVAYEEGSGGPGGAEYVVNVRDLRNGKVLHSVPTGTYIHHEPPAIKEGLVQRFVGIGPARAIVVKSDGAVAWIVQTLPEEGTYQVHALDGSGSRVLAEGPEIDPSSLALGGSTLYWTQNGKPASTTLH